MGGGELFCHLHQRFGKFHEMQRSTLKTFFQFCATWTKDVTNFMKLHRSTLTNVSPSCREEGGGVGGWVCKVSVRFILFLCSPHASKKVCRRENHPGFETHGEGHTKSKTGANIGLTIPGNWSFEIRRISPVKSGRFHL